jgi:acetyltransferase-like isoleucine patch superfamily enzyme
MTEQNMIAPSAVCYENVILGDRCVLENFVIVGNPAQGDVYPTHLGNACFIRSHTVIYSGNQIGDYFQTGHGVLIREDNQIGDEVSVGSHTVIEHHVQIGQRVRIHSNAFIPEFSILENDCWVGPNVVLTNARYPLGKHVKQTLQGSRIGVGAKIGANATLLPGVVIGKNALVGAGSVVVKDVSDGMVVVGNPARVIGKVSDLPEYQAIILD